MSCYLSHVDVLRKRISMSLLRFLPRAVCLAVLKKPIHHCFMPYCRMCGSEVQTFFVFKRDVGGLTDYFAHHRHLFSFHCASNRQGSESTHDAKHVCRSYQPEKYTGAKLPGTTTPPCERYAGSVQELQPSGVRCLGRYPKAFIGSDRQHVMLRLAVLITPTRSRRH